MAALSWLSWQELAVGSLEGFSKDDCLGTENAMIKASLFIQARLYFAFSSLQLTLSSFSSNLSLDSDYLWHFIKAFINKCLLAISDVGYLCKITFRNGSRETLEKSILMVPFRYSVDSNVVTTCKLTVIRRLSA